MPLKRPFSVTLLLLLVLSLSVWGVIRFVAAIRWWGLLNEFGSSLSPLYLSITGAGWGVVGGVLSSGILSRKRWARPAIVTSILLWLIEYWIERIFFQEGRANLFFALTCTIVVFVITLVIIRLKSTTYFFIRSEEHEQPDQTPNSK